MTPLLSVEAHLALEVEKLGFASIADVLATRDPLPPPQWGDPIRVGERVHLTLGYITAMMPVGRHYVQHTPVVAGTAAVTAGTVVAIGDVLHSFATVEWDDGRVQTLHLGSLIPSQLRQSEAVRFHAGTRA